MDLPYFDSGAPDYDLWDASRDPSYDWERIDDDPYMMDEYDAVAAHGTREAPLDLPEHDHSHGDDLGYHATRHKKKKKHHHHDESSSSTSEESTTSSISTSTSTSETSTITSTSESTTSKTSTKETSISVTSTSSISSSSSYVAADSTSIEPTAAQHNAEETSLTESPILISSTSFSSSDDGTSPIFSDEDDLTIVNKIVNEPQTSFVVSTVYAVNTMMPGSYPNIDYNAIDYNQLGQIGVFTDSGHELHVASYWISVVVALMVVFMLRV